MNQTQALTILKASRKIGLRNLSPAQEAEYIKARDTLNAFQFSSDIKTYAEIAFDLGRLDLLED